MLKIGTVVNGLYKILNVVGKGGMSVVYLAINERANKQWAIKEIRKDGVLNYETVKQGLIVETNMLKQLNHPNLPSIVDVIEDDESFLIVMDYIEGVTLSKLLNEQGKLPQDQVIDWAKQLCDVLNYLHTQEQPIIYRDLKPGNIMLRPDGRIILIDFGIARTFKKTSVADTTCLGTIGYAAPEQFGGKGQTDARTDIYCLGATLYHLVTGQNPCEPPYEMRPIRQWNPALSSGFENIIWKCTQINPEERFQSAQNVSFALEHYREFDIEVKRKQKQKVALFSASLGVTACLAISLLTVQSIYANRVNNNYNYYLQVASESKTQKEYEELCNKSANLKPRKEDAYRSLLQDSLLSDGILTEQEAYEIRDILSAQSNVRRTNEDYFRKNQENYEKFAFLLGVAYFTAYEDAQNKQLSKKWLDVAANAQKLSDKEKEMAVLLQKIADYYAKVGQESRSGDSAVSFKDLWNDLKALKNYATNDYEDRYVRCLIYREISYQINNFYEEFQKMGTSDSQLIATLEEMEAQKDKDLLSVNSEDVGNFNSNVEMLNKNLEQAYASLGKK